MKGRWPITMMCEVLDVSPGGFFSWEASQRCSVKGPGRSQSDEALLAHIRSIRQQLGGEYGWPRMHKELPDRVQRRFEPAAPNVLWSGDITYLPTDEGWLCLAAVLDLHSRQVVGWSMRPHMQTSLVKDALLMACFRRKPAPGLVFHSDRGSQYCSREFQDTLKDWGIPSSMSRKGNCWDNAPTESLWGRLKTACVRGQRFATHEQTRQAVMDWIAFYNHSRLHSALGYLSPMQFEQRWMAAQHQPAA